MVLLCGAVVLVCFPAAHLLIAWDYVIEWQEDVDDC